MMQMQTLRKSTADWSHVSPHASLRGFDPCAGYLRATA